MQAQEQRRSVLVSLKVEETRAGEGMSRDESLTNMVRACDAAKRTFAPYLEQLKQHDPQMAFNVHARTTIPFVKVTAREKIIQYLQDSSNRPQIIESISEVDRCGVPKKIEMAPN